MEIVINIPDKKYERLPYIDILQLREYIENGIPLPKGHGDLVDRDAINEQFYGIWRELDCCSNKPTYKRLLDNWSMCMGTAPTIIEADEEE